MSEAHLEVIRAAFKQLGWNMTPVNALEEKLEELENERDQLKTAMAEVATAEIEKDWPIPPNIL